jgi:F-type H+-transporting ATPase subunit a
VEDQYTVAFQSPFSDSRLVIDFKRLLCRASGWNGVVSLGRKRAIDLTPTRSAFWMWVAALLLIALFWKSAPEKGRLVPKGMGTLLETLVLFVRDDIARTTMGEEAGDRYTPYLLNCFFFILIMNLLGLVPYAGSATASIGVTAGLALLTFILTQLAGIKAVGVRGYLKHLTGGVHPALWPLMIPVEFVGLITKPFALTVRLFANMLAGHIIILFLLGLTFILKASALAPIWIGFAVAAYLLEIFVAFVQAYIFTLLSALFIGMGVAMRGHGGSESGGRR